MTYYRVSSCTTYLNITLPGKQIHNFINVNDIFSVIRFVGIYQTPTLFNS